MIVCSCNVLTASQILATLETEASHQPRTPAQAYRCLGCRPDCGRCLVTVRALLAEARRDPCSVGCAICPGAADADLPAEHQPTPFLLAAE